MEMKVRPMITKERKYAYTQSHQLMMQTGCIGHLRADFGSNGKEFFSTWHDHRTDLKSNAFKKEFDEVVNRLREDDRYGGILKSRADMTAYCDKHPDSGFVGSYTKEYGFRVDTKEYSYLLRLNVVRGDYNLYCYCYRKESLDRHLERAEKGIRFISPHYKEKFHIADGDKVRIVRSNGEKEDQVCRYIDEYHVEVGQTLYHICEFAERMEQLGNTVIPLRSALPEMCYSTMPSTGELIIIKRGEAGYYRCEFSTDDRVYNRDLADDRNANLGVSKGQEEAMIAGSMFGWDVPSADPARYDESGRPVRAKNRDRGDER